MNDILIIEEECTPSWRQNMVTTYAEPEVGALLFVVGGVIVICLLFLFLIVFSISKSVKMADDMRDAKVQERKDKSKSNTR